MILNIRKRIIRNKFRQMQYFTHGKENEQKTCLIMNLDWFLLYRSFQLLLLFNILTQIQGKNEILPKKSQNDDFTIQCL